LEGLEGGTVEEKGLEAAGGLEDAALKLNTLAGGDCAAAPKLKPVFCFGCWGSRAVTGAV